ncbi:hypothetical protein Tco_0883020 [Tanacetum coccineum]
MGLTATQLDEGTDVEYQVYKTQSTRFEVSVPDQNKGKTSYEVEPDTKTLLLTTVADIQALLEDSKEELIDASDDDVFKAREDMNEYIQEPETKETQPHHSIETPTEEPLSTKHQSPSPHKEQPQSTKNKKTNASDSESSSCSYTFKADRGKGIARDTNESPPKLVKASSKVRSDPDTLILAHLDKEEKLEKAAKEARLLEINKSELIKVIHEVAKEVGVDLKSLQSSKDGRKRKAQELEPKVRIPELKCNRSLPKRVPFVNNLVDVDTLLTHLVMASNFSTIVNSRFCLALRSLIESHLGKEKLKSKRVKLEAVGYSLN